MLLTHHKFFDLQRLGLAWPTGPQNIVQRLCALNAIGGLGCCPRQGLDANWKTDLFDKTPRIGFGFYPRMAGARHTSPLK